MPYVNKHYNQLLYFAYEIETNYVARAVVTPPNVLAPIAHIPVPPVSSSMPQDAHDRMLLLANAVDHAETQALADPNLTAHMTDPNTLKVFIVPEFFFRPFNFAGPIPGGMTDVQYSEFVYNQDHTRNLYAQQASYSYIELINITAGLHNMFTDPRFDNWLFVPGSIFTSIQTDSGATAYMNTTGIIKGGPGAPGTFVHKRAISNLDGAPMAMAGINNPDLKPILQNESIEQSRIFICDGITFGIEVCLDHGMSRLVNVLNSYPSNIRPIIDIQLLTACGMPINPTHVAVRQGGHILRCDGQRGRIPISEIQTKVLRIGTSAPSMTAIGSTGNFILPPQIQIPSLPQQKIAYYPIQRL